MIIHSGNDCQIHDPFVALAKKNVVVLIFGILPIARQGKAGADQMEPPSPLIS